MHTAFATARMRRGVRARVCPSAARGPPGARLTRRRGLPTPRRPPLPRRRVWD